MTRTHDAFFTAVQRGDLVAIEEAVRADPDLLTASVPAMGHVSPLVLALYHRQSGAALTLLRLGAPVSLAEAATLGETERLGALLQSGADVNAFTPDGWTPLHLAAHFGHVDAVRMLLHAGADVGTVSQNNQGNIPLHAGLAGQNHHVVSLLLEAGSDPNTVQAQGYTSLHEAAFINDPVLVALLLQHGADPDATDREGRTARQLAHEQGNRAAAEVLERAKLERRH